MTDKEWQDLSNALLKVQPADRVQATLEALLRRMSEGLVVENPLAWCSRVVYRKGLEEGRFRKRYLDLSLDQIREQARDHMSEFVDDTDLEAQAIARDQLKAFPEAFLAEFLSEETLTPMQRSRLKAKGVARLRELEGEDDLC